MNHLAEMRKRYAVAAVGNWLTPATAYPRAHHGKAEIKTMRWGRGKYGACYGVRGFDYFYAHYGFDFTALKIGRRVWMVDDPPHAWAMQDHATHYYGRVLVGGLGLALIVHALQARREVKQILVVEREPDVIALVAPLLSPRKLKIVQGDFWDGTRHKPDGVFLDVWVGDATKMLTQALQASIVMREMFPAAEVFRIHGFNNNLLNQTMANLQDAKAQTVRTWFAQSAGKPVGPASAQTLDVAARPRPETQTG